MRSLDTPRLRLEPQTAAHAEAMFAVLCDPAIYRFENAPPASPGALRERYAKLETRRSGDGCEQWLNWVLRRHGGGLIGYVQATVRGDGEAFVAYVLGSAHWGHGLASEAVAAMLAELAAHHGVHMALAVVKRANLRSRRLLERLGFGAADAADVLRLAVAADEDLLQRRIAATVPPR
jgi:[ribosomal protein S5]-alanine N-acetyltransferase